MKPNIGLWLTYLSFTDAFIFFPEQGPETFFLGIPKVWYLYP